MVEGLIALLLVQLTGPDGGRIDISASEVTSVREPRGQGHFAAGTHCIVVMSNGRFIGVREDCGAVRMKLTPLPSRAPCVVVCGETNPR